VASDPAAPRTYRVALASTSATFEVADGERILAAARRAGIWLPFECGWGSCGTCKVTLVDGQVRVLFPGAPAIDPRDARRCRMLICQTTPCSDVTIKPLRADGEPRPERPTQDYPARLLGADQLGPGIRRFRFTLARPALYRPGQYAIIDLGSGLRRCYSMSGLAGSPVIEFVAKQQPGGPGSGRLFALAPGNQVQIELPYGDMWLRPSTRPIALLAGGTGISPILALTLSLSAAGDPRPVRVFYGAATHAELACWDQLSTAITALPDGRLCGALESPAHAPGSLPVTTGFVTDALAPHLEEIADADIYLAGPPPMVNAALERLQDAKIPLDRIHYDRFG
jgi:toluene monooxygenase electron transfer component